MINRDIIKEFEENIGYCFKNKNYLCQALTHSSYANEMRMSKLANNERLEFLGDAVLELMSSENIYENNPNMYEGEMKNGKMNGRGKFIPYNGIPIEGIFKNDVKVSSS